MELLDSHKGALTLIIAVLLLFSVWIFVGNTYVSPAIEDTGENFKMMVDDTFDNIDSNKRNPGGK